MDQLTTRPTIPVNSAAELGLIARTQREALGLGLRQTAPASGVGVRFLSEFERGKPTAEVGKVLMALHGIGLDLAVIPRKDATEIVEGGWSKRLGMAFPYDWSNSQMDATTFIRQVLIAHRFDDVLKLVGHFGLDRVGQALPRLDNPAIEAQVAAMLARIFQGMLLARTGEPHATAA